MTWADQVKSIVGLVLVTGLTLAIAVPTHLLLYAAVAIGINWVVALVHAIPFQTEKLFDFFGAITFSSLAILSAAVHLAKESNANDYWRSLVLSCLVVVWAFRLGSFLFLRFRNTGKDDRFDEIRTDPVKFLVIWSLQGLWAFITVLPVELIHTQAKSQSSIQASDVIGIVIWIVGFGIEVIADRQKTEFKKDKANQNKYISVGLWYYSRHPNYFGEIMLWIGITVVAAPQLTTAGYIIVSCFSPALVTTLLVFVSGIPILEAKADAKWGSDPHYQYYKKRTSVLIPWFPRNIPEPEVLTP
ncbi:hypothetical protein THRCLA_04540 [Thraustotheca clavata]|uniref:Uncharacterized protein n=1 Tax=Thraustotheca clavata TaxID=74557 RepID=A0A1V9ZYN9_9STRA|nr:hypothetical protein THRCLA_04540 [Thraustotheca clavata]